MQKKDPDGFNIRFDDDDDEEKNSVYTGQIERDQIDQLRKRLTRLAVLLFLLISVIAAGAAFFHLQVRNRVIGRDAGEDRMVEKLGERLNSGLSALAVRQAKVESALAKSKAAVEENAKALEKTVSPLKKELAALKKELANLKKELPGINKSLGSLKKGLASETARLAALKKELTALKKETAPLKKEVNSLGDRVTLTEKTIYENVRKSLEDFAERIAAATAADGENLASAITDLQDELPPLQKKLEDAFAQIRNLDESMSDTWTRELKILAADVENTSNDIRRVNGRIDVVSQKTQEEVTRIVKDYITEASSATVTHDLLDDKLTLERRFHKFTLDDHLMRLNKRIKKLEKSLGTSRTSNPGPAPSAAPPPADGKKTPAPRSAPPPANGIEEENLQ